MSETKDILIKLGGKEWRGGRHHRVYVPRDFALDAVGLWVSMHGTRNVKSATLDGEKISNSEASEMLRDIASVYYDVVADEWVGRYSKITDKIREAVETAEKETESC